MERRSQTAYMHGAIKACSWCAGCGIIALILYSSQAFYSPQVTGGSRWTQFLSVLGVSLAVAGASLFAGGFLGFLFGIPRALQGRGATTSTPQTPGAEPTTSGDVSPAAMGGTVGTGKDSGYLANTNLEEISDWLTKILVGVGLTQVTKLPGAVRSYAAFVASGLGDFAGSEVLAVAELVFYLIVGFLILYLWTRLHLAGAFREADNITALRGTVEEVAGKVDELKAQQDRDGRALVTVQSHLDTNKEAVPQDALRTVVKDASDGVRGSLLDQATPGKAQDATRAIDVLRALIAADAPPEHPEYHAFLAAHLLTLDGSSQEAFDELSKAMEIRGPSKGVYGRASGYFEADRALCRVNQDGGLERRTPSDAESKDAILEDLKAALEDPYTAQGLATSPWYHDLRQWMDLNDPDRTDLPEWPVPPTEIAASDKS
jgi:hypothetical protein